MWVNTDNIYDVENQIGVVIVGSTLAPQLVCMSTGTSFSNRVNLDVDVMASLNNLSDDKLCDGVAHPFS